MAVPSCPKVHIESMLSVTPFKTTEPRQERQVLMEGDYSKKAETLKGRQHMLFYYPRKTDEESGWYLAGWSKETLARALTEQPVLAGRLTGSIRGHRGYAIVSNDGGVRLIEAKIPITLSEFLNFKKKDAAEADLVFWKDIEENSPEFCPLLYVQVTNFQCGGYSIGISCSLLVADLLIMGFLTRWAEIHSVTTGSSTSRVFKTPLFYNPILKPPGNSPADYHSNISCSNNSDSRTVIFNVVAENLNSDDGLYKQLALLCVEEAEKKVGNKMASGFSLFKKEDSQEVIRVEHCTKQMEHYNKQLSGINWKMTQTSWDDFGVHELTFAAGNKPALVSCWNVGSISEGFVMLITSTKDDSSGITVIVTFQN